MEKTTHQERIKRILEQLDASEGSAIRDHAHELWLHFKLWEIRSRQAHAIGDLKLAAKYASVGMEFSKHYTAAKKAGIVDDIAELNRKLDDQRDFARGILELKCQSKTSEGTESN